MCLTLNDSKDYKKAKKDIKCYKVVLEVEDGKYETYFKKSVVEIGTTYESEILLNSYKYGLITVEKALHSFEKLKDAKQFIRFSNEDNCKIIECVIPKGSMYFEGDFYIYICAYKSYASDKLIYKKLK